MTELFYRGILPLTVTGGLTMLFLLAAEPLTRRLGGTWRYYSRLVPILMFILPFSLLAPALAKPAAQVLGAEMPTPAFAAMGDFLETAAAMPPPQTNDSVMPVQWAVLIWGAGAAIFAIYRVFVLIQFRIKVKHESKSVTSADVMCELETQKQVCGVRRGVRLAVCPRVGSPMLLGILRPVILLPSENLPADDLRLILRHELTHCKRGDLICKLAAVIISTVHWFNPLAHVLLRQINELCELSCDEALARRMDAEQRREYGFVLLAQATPAPASIPIVCSRFSKEKNILESRLKNIMNLKKKKLPARLIGVLAALCLCSAGAVAAFAISPQADAILEAAPASGTAQVDAVIALDEADKALKAGQAASSEGVSGGVPAYTSTPDAGEDDSILVAGYGSAPESGELIAESETTPENQTFQPYEPNEFTAERIKTLNLIFPIGKLATKPDGTIGGVYISAKFMEYHGHTGTDFAAPKGSEILAAADGIVMKAEETPGGYGRHTIIDHGNGITTLYGHCDELLVSTGDKVKQGDVIAKLGRTGNTTGYACHAELRTGGNYIDITDFVEIPSK